MLNRITGRNDRELAEIKNLYESSFPPEERREFAALTGMLDLPEMNLNICSDGEKTAGFVIFWVLNGFTFIEHMAVFPDLRGRQYGHRIAAEITDSMKCPVLLEVEKPSGNDSIRRVSFWNRCGFELLDREYMQPSYDAVKPAVPLRLMSNQAWSEKDLNAAVIEIDDIVYRRHYSGTER